MKTNKILLALIFILGIVWFAADRQLFYYGKSKLNITSSVPFGIKPVFRYDFKGGFALEDELGFYFVSKGETRYRGSNVEFNVSEILKYGFSNDKLIAHVIDTSNKDYFIQIEKNEDPSLTKYLDANISVSNNLPSFTNDFKWIEIKNDKKLIRTLELVRNYALLLGILLFIIVVLRLIISKVIKKRE